MLFEEIQETRDRYAPRLLFEVPRMDLAAEESVMQRRLPMRAREWRVKH